MDRKRQEAEALIYKVMDTLDPSGTNTDYYKKAIAEMSDSQFKSWLGGKFPFKFHVKPFEIEPDVYTCVKALNIMGVPLCERISLPYLYRNSDGLPVWTPYVAFTGYTHLRKPKQFITKKNHLSTNIEQRDMKSGLLINDDKGARESDREFESLAVMGLDKTTREFSRVKADAMRAKNQAYNTINVLGDVHESDITIEVDDSIAKNTASAYLIASHLMTNMVIQDYMLPSTMKDKKRKVEREV